MLVVNEKWFVILKVWKKNIDNFRNWEEIISQQSWKDPQYIWNFGTKLTRLGRVIKMAMGFEYYN